MVAARRGARRRRCASAMRAAVVEHEHVAFEPRAVHAAPAHDAAQLSPCAGQHVRARS